MAPSSTAPLPASVAPWLRFSLWGACVFVVAGGLYLLSFGPVSRYYQSHPPERKPSTILYTPKGTSRAEISYRSVGFPRWVSAVYRPAFRLLGSREGQGGQKGIYRRYWDWWVDRKADCLKNLRRLDQAKRKWAEDTQRTNGAMPYAAHIVDYLPKGSEARCPTGAEYRFHPVGMKPECSFHGDAY
jgi:hypothetical protein